MEVRIRRRGPTAVVAVVLAATLHAQAPPPSAPQPRFDVVSVKPSSADGTDGPMMVSDGMRGGDRWVAENATLLGMIRSAYALEYPSPSQIVGGPDWLDTARFNVTATFEGSPALNDLRQMAQTLLAERFNLRTHVERREIPIYRLVLNRPESPLPKTIELLKDVDCRAVRSGPPPEWKAGSTPRCFSGTMYGPISEIQTGGMSFSELARNLESQLQRPVIDATNMRGDFAFTLRFAAVGGAGRGFIGQGGIADAAGTVDAPSLFTALQDQLGLKLESARETRDVLVIDRIEQPNAN